MPRGRPKGSKNKPKTISNENQVVVKKRRGRPPKSSYVTQSQVETICEIEKTTNKIESQPEKSMNEAESQPEKSMNEAESQKENSVNLRGFPNQNTLFMYLFLKNTMKIINKIRNGMTVDEVKEMVYARIPKETSYGKIRSSIYENEVDWNFIINKAREHEKMEE